MSDPIGEVKGVGPELKAKLEAAGIHNMHQFLEHAHTAKQRNELASKVGVTHVVIKEIANRADLMRVNGIGSVYSNLLEEAGVNSCKELQHRKPDNLEATLQEVHAKRKLAQQLPTLAQITEWVAEAKKLAATSPE
jgi:predicted flap endonuclease-1-like 5' DNA nuclease